MSVSRATALTAAGASAVVGLLIGYLARKSLCHSPSSSSAKKSIEHSKPVSERMYEQDRILNEYLILHFGEDFAGKFTPNKTVTGADGYAAIIGSAKATECGNFGNFNTTTGTLEAPQFPSFALNFPARVAELAAHFAGVSESASPSGRALDVGCAVGRTTFELSRFFDSAIGLDYSRAFVETAQDLAGGAVRSVSVPVEGAVTVQTTVSLGDRFRPQACSFQVGDATALDTAALGQFDCVTAANLIDRLPAPRAFLAACGSLVKRGGVLVITSPYTWLAEFTPPEEWLAGGAAAGGAQDGLVGGETTFQALRKALEGDFELVHDSHLPFLIRETARKNQFTHAHATVWRRK